MKSLLKKESAEYTTTLKIPCVPVALNTGKVWPKNSFINPNNVHITFLEPIMPGKNKNVFVKILEKKIYAAIESL